MHQRRLVSSLLVALLFAPLWAHSAFAGYSLSTWHSLTQTQRNSAIVSEAKTWLDLKSGLSCKEWARRVTRDVSGGVSLPSTQASPYDYLWLYDPTGNTIGMSMPIKYAKPGYIVQMRLKSGWPHTAIVAANDGRYITFIESNWDSTPADSSDAYVRYRKVTYAQFSSSLESAGAFSVYYIQ